MSNYNKFKSGYDELLKTMVVKSQWKKKFSQAVKRIKKNKFRYRKIEDMTGVPWYFIGLLHLRESGCDFTKHLHNGDTLEKRTRKVPAGRPKNGKPPFTFEESAVDALELMNLHKVSDWSLSHMLYLQEQYNGFGYRGKKINSPYLWSGTNHYTKGKYVRDGVYSPSEVDQQLGVVPVLLELMNDKNEEYKEAKKEVETHSKKVRIGDYTKWLTGVITSIGLAWTQIWDWTKDYGLYALAALAAGFVVYLEWNKRRIVKDYKEGRYIPSGRNKGKK